MANIELRHLRTLMALRETGSLVDAAEQLCLTQSALSHQVKDLEERVGNPLFIRKTRPVRFTPAGQRLLALAEQVLPEVRAAERDLARMSSGRAGRLYMAIECHSCFDWLLPAIEHFRDDWPEVELDLSSAFAFTPLPALAQGDLDLVVTSDPQLRDALEYLYLFSYEAVLVLSPDHELASAEFVEPEALAAETLITYPVERSRLDLFRHFLDPAGVSPARTRTAELTPMLIQLVASGRGVACLPDWAVAEYRERGLVLTRSLGAQGLWQNLYAAVRRDLLPAPYIDSFVATARQTCFARLVGIRSTPAAIDPRGRAQGTSE